MNRVVWGFCALISLQGGLAAQESDFGRGEGLFMANRPQEALGFLEGALLQDPAHLKASLYLGIVYQQLDRVDDAIAVYRKILPRAGNEAARVAFNLGGIYFRLENNDYAEEFYTQALTLDPAYGPAYLNRANLQLKKGDLAAALPDYDMYLALEPRSSQRSAIERLCALIRGEFAAEERRRIFAEEEAERQRILAAEAEERRQALLREVSASLQSAAEETRGSSAGTEDVLGYDGEFELE